MAESNSVLAASPCPEYIGGPRPPPNLLGEGVGVQVGLLPPTRLMEVESKLDSTFLSHTPRGGVGVQGGLLPLSRLGRLDSPSPLSWRLGGGGVGVHLHQSDLEGDSSPLPCVGHDGAHEAQCLMVPLRASTPEPSKIFR
jgi:hypothetical protein